MRPYSAARPDFHRIYRYRQLVDVAMSRPMGKALDGEMEFSVSIDELAPLFDEARRALEADATAGAQVLDRQELAAVVAAELGHRLAGQPKPVQLTFERNFPDAIKERVRANWKKWGLPELNDPNRNPTWKYFETTGAGDAFNGGFAVALAEGMSPADAVRFGAATAGISVTRSGTAPSMPTRAEIETLLLG